MRCLCVFLPVIVGNGMHSDFTSSAYVPFLRGEEDEGTHRVALLGHVHNQSLVSNDAGDVDAIFEGAAPDLISSPITAPFCRIDFNRPKSPALTSPRNLRTVPESVRKRFI